MDNAIRYAESYARIADNRDWFDEQNAKYHEEMHKRYLDEQQERKMRRINKFNERYKKINIG